MITQQFIYVKYQRSFEIKISFFLNNGLYLIRFFHLFVDFKQVYQGF